MRWATAHRRRLEPESLLPLSEVLAAKRRLRPFLDETPTVFSERHDAFFKLETQQETGAYKVRGALNALLKHVESRDPRPIVAASAGNHGAAVAWAASHLGLHCCIVVPEDAPQAKIDRIVSMGGRVIRHGEHFQESLLWARKWAFAHGARFLHAFDDVDVMAGQGTVALELLPYQPDVVILPIGGGGLISGCVPVLQAAGIRIIGVQVEGVDAMRRALNGGKSRIQPLPTVADGLRVAQASRLAVQICAQGVEEILLVTEDSVRATMASLARHEGWKVEGAGAVGVAALERIQGNRRAVLLSGSNVDDSVLQDVLRTNATD